MTIRGRGALAALLLLLGLALILAGGKKSMKTTKDVVDNLLNLKEEQYYGNVVDLFEEKETLLLEQEEFEGIAINAPPRVDVNRYDGLPVILATRASILREHELPQQRHNAIVVADLTTGEVFFGPALVDEKAATFYRQAPPPAREPLPEDAETDGASASLDRIDARARLRIPWRNAQVTINVLYYDWRSNPVAVELTGGEPPPPACAGPPHPEPSPEPPEDGEPPCPSYEKTPESPPPPKHGGAFAIAPKDAQGRLIVRGAFMLPARPYHLCKEIITHKLADGDEGEVAATVPATFIVLSPERGAALREDWSLPVYSHFALNPGDKLAGCFAIDALAEAPVKLAPGEYAAYLVIDAEIAGPVKFKL
jgi:hypothetical protein